MNDIEEIESWQGQNVVDPEDEKLGKLDEVWFRLGEDDPVLISVKSGLLGRKHRLVPLDGSTVSRDFVRVRWAKAVVDEAPDVDEGAILTPDDLGRITTHYAVDVDGAQNAALETGSARAERLRAAQEKLDRADELEAEAERAAEDAKVAAQRVEQAERNAADAEQRRVKAAESARAARAEADEALRPPAA